MGQLKCVGCDIAQTRGTEYLFKVQGLTLVHNIYDMIRIIVVAAHLQRGKVSGIV